MDFRLFLIKILIFENKNIQHIVVYHI